MESRKIIQSFAIAISGIGAIPLPFSDFYLMSPLQCFMVMAIARKYDKKINFKTARALIATAGGGFIGRQICSSLMRFIPVVGRFIAIPFAYGWTFGIGEMAILYFETDGKATEEELKETFEREKEQASSGKDGRVCNIEEALHVIENYLTEEEYSLIKDRIKTGEKV